MNLRWDARLKVDASLHKRACYILCALGISLVDLGGSVVVGGSVVGGGSLSRVDATSATVVRSLTNEERAAMVGVVWHPGCPVGLKDLRRVEGPVLGMDGATYAGVLVVHKNLAVGVAGILAELYQAKFPIESMVPIESFGGDDDRSTMANNSSAFNCRPVTGGHAFSEHAYGRAIDINPVQNPYVRSDGTVLDVNAKRFIDRAATAGQSGVITANGTVVRIFRSKGWRWGGLFKRTKDYQHFSTSGS